LRYDPCPQYLRNAPPVIDMNEKLGRFVTEKPLITVLAVIFVTFLMMAINTSPDTFGLEKNDKEDESDFLPDNDVANANKEIDDNYGVPRKYLQIIVYGKDGNVLTKEALLDILEVERRIANSSKVGEVLFPGPGSIMSLSSSLARSLLQNNAATYEEMRGVLEGLNQTALEGILGDAAAQMGMFLTKDFSMNLEENGIVKAKGTLMLIQLNADKYEDIIEDKYNPILDADEEIEDIIDSTDFMGVKRMGIFEDEYMNDQIDKETGGVMGRLFMLVFILIIVILFITYRSFFDTLISLLALVFAITWMSGIGVLLGLKFTAMYDAVPIMLLGLGIDYAIHLVMRYREERTLYNKNSRDALILTTASVGAALFLATLTTAISFGSNTVSEIRPMREFAIFALVGILSAFTIMVTFVPGSKMLYHGSRVERFFQGIIAKVYGLVARGLPLKPAVNERARGRGGDGKKVSGDTHLTRILAKGAVAAEHHAYPVIAGAVVLSLICTGLSLQLETEFDFTEFLPSDAQITDDIKYLTDNFELGTEEVNILVRGKIDDPDVLVAMAKTEENILDDANINEQEPIESILTLMRGVSTGDGDIEINETFAGIYNDSDSDGDGIPNRNITVLFDFLRNHEAYSFNLIRVLHYDNESREYDGAVIRVAVNSQNGAKNGEISHDLDDDIAPLENEPKVTKVVPTSGPVLFHYVIRSIETSGMRSLLITVVVAGIVLTIVFYVTDKSWALGIITEIPVILVIAWVFASMYLIGMELNVMTIMISSLTVGLGITYGIHISHRFVEDLSKLGDIDKASSSTVANTGAALFGAAVTTIGGFGILIFAPIPPLKEFGAISSLAISFSFIASVFILPSFLSVWAKYVKKKNPDYFKQHAVEKGAPEEQKVGDDGKGGKETEEGESAKKDAGEKEEREKGEKTEEGESAQKDPKNEDEKNVKKQGVDGKDGNIESAGTGGAMKDAASGND